MLIHENFDDDHLIEDMFNFKERLVAVSNVFARSRKQMSLAEQKAFVLALAQLDFKKASEEQSNVVRLNIRDLAVVLGYKSDTSDISQHVWDAIKGLPRDSYIEIADKDKEFFASGSVISSIMKRKGTGYVRVKFEEDYMPLFCGLAGQYMTMWSLDIFQMSGKRSIQFYELLRQMSYGPYEIGKNMYSYGWGIKALKDMFEIPKEGSGSYMRGKDGFDRANFERRVIDPLCKDLENTRMIKLVPQADGKLYEKVKSGRRVQGYRFSWSYSARPAGATEKEVKAISARKDQDSNIVLGKRRNSKDKKAAKPSFSNFQQRSYDMDKVEAMLLGKTLESVEARKKY